MRLRNKFILALLRAMRESEDNYWMRLSLEDFIAVSQEGGDPMEWKSPWEPRFHFFINRYENTVQSSDPREGSYIIEIKVADGYYNHLIDLRLSEIELSILIDSIDFFTYEMTDARDFSNIIYSFNTNSDMSTPQLVLQRVDVLQFFENPDDTDDDIDPEANSNNPYYDNIYNECRDIQFTIQKYNAFYQTIAPVCTFFISSEELCDFAYDLFFVGLIDLDVNAIQDLLSDRNIDIDKDIRNMFLDHGKFVKSDPRVSTNYNYINFVPSPYKKG